MKDGGVRLAFAAAALVAAGPLGYALGGVAAAGAEHGAAYSAHETFTADRAATADEERFCLDNLELLGPASGDCSRVPLFGTLYEDDPWGRWDCRIMGNRQCGDLLFFAAADGRLVGFHINDPHRPGCFVEPSSVRGGFEIIGFSRISGRGAPEYMGDPLGFEVPCPGDFPALV